MIPFKNFSILLFEHLVKLGLGAFVGIYIARSLGPEEYGNFSYILSFAMIFIPFYSLGSDDWLIANVAKKTDPKKIHQYLGTSFVARLLGSALGIVLCCLSVFLYNNNKELSFFIILYSLFMTFKSFDCINLYLVAKENIKRVSILRNIFYAISSLLKVLILLTHPKAELLIYVACLEFTLLSAIYLYVYLSSIGSLATWSFHRGIFDELVKLAIPLTILTFINISIVRIDQIMLGNMVSKAQLGEYSFVAKLVELFQFLPMILLTVLLPKVFKKIGSHYDSYKSRVLFLIFLLSLCFAFICVTLGVHVVPLVVGKKYLLTSSILRIYVWQSVFFFLFLAKQKFSIAENKLRKPLSYGMISLISNVILNYFLIPIYGVYGAVYASVISFTASELFMTLFDSSFRRENIQIMKSFNIVKTFRELKELAYGK